jgi:hypothetical protein
MTDRACQRHSPLPACRPFCHCPAKLRAYAQGRVPLYLHIDQLADPATVTLFSDPVESSYRTCSPAAAGQALRLPEPFGIQIDTRRLLA